MDDGDLCRHLVAREVEGPGGPPAWVYGFPCGKPALVRLPGREACADHVTIATDVTSCL